MLTFSAHPAAVTIGVGIRDAWRYLTATWQTWAPIALAVGAANVVASTLLTSLAPIDYERLITTDPVTGHVRFGSDWASILAPYIESTIVLAVISTVAGWAITAIAIRGLRGRPLGGWIVIRGLIAFATQLLLGIVIFVPLALIFVGGVLRPFVWLAVLPGLVVALYLWVRLAFVAIAVFDGFGPIAAIEESWRLSRWSWWRLLGWGLLATLISAAINWASGYAVLPFAFANAQPLSDGITSALEVVGTCLTTFLLAVLYESQRARHDPTLYPYPTYPTSPYPGGWPGAYPGPYPGASPAAAYPPGWGPPGYPYPVQPPNPYQPGGSWPPPPPQGSWPAPPPQGSWPPPPPPSPWASPQPPVETPPRDDTPPEPPADTAP